MVALSSNPEIIIKPADKGDKIVILDTTTYISEALRQLSDARAYRQLASDPTHVNNTQVRRLIDELEQCGSISPKVASYLVFDKPKTPQLYLLPKIHKPTRPPPGRPIVSANHFPTERISVLVDHILHPFVKDLPSFIEDTTDLIKKLQNLPPIPEGDLLVTLDLVSLYTNINMMEALKVAKNTLTAHRDDTDVALKNNDIVRMLSLVLRLNNFDFNGQHLNTSHPTLKFTFEASETAVSFLDTMIQLDQNRLLYTTLYNKPSDSHSYLYFSSCHPHHQKTGGPYSQLLRVKRICAHNTDFETNSQTIVKHYCHRGYPALILQTSLDKVKSIQRSDLLTIDEEEEHPTETPLVCITTYHPQNPPIKDILKQNWPTLLIEPQ